MTDSYNLLNKRIRTLEKGFVSFVFFVTSYVTLSDFDRTLNNYGEYGIIFYMSLFFISTFGVIYYITIISTSIASDFAPVFREYVTRHHKMTSVIIIFLAASIAIIMPIQFFDVDIKDLVTPIVTTVVFSLIASYNKISNWLKKDEGQ